MKRILAGTLTVALMGLLLWSGLRRPAPTPEVAEAEDAAAGAEQRLRALLDSARDGDVSAYLEAFSGPLRQRLERAADEQGRAAFAADLRRAARARKGLAVFAPEPDGPDTVRITVEAVYPDHNERRTYRLDRTPDGWLVTDVDSVRGHTPLVPFGTPASFQEPEGIPVPTGPSPTRDPASGVSP